MKQDFKKAQKIKRSNYKDAKQQARHIKKVSERYSNYLERTNSLLIKAEITRARLKGKANIAQKDLVTDLMLEKYISHAYRQIDQIKRRVLEGEVIPHGEKVFSLFEPHTEWISKGKAKAPVELGKRVCIFEDQFGFILHHIVMEKETDSEIAVSFTRETKNRFPNLSSGSYDKGFYSAKNKAEIQTILQELSDK